MAVNKNFVVKNGLEVNTSLILADASTNRVGVGSTTPDFTLDVNGDIGVTGGIIVSGVSTITNDLQVGTSGSIFYVSDSNNNVGIGTSVPNPIYTLEVRSPVSTGQTALYVYGDMRVTGDINLDDITLDDATIQDLIVTRNVRLNSISGITTISGYTDINNNADISLALNVGGISTFVGFSTFQDYVFIQDGLNVGGGVTVTGAADFNGSLDVDGLTELDDVNVSGVATVATLYAAAGIITATSVNVSTATTTKDLLVTGIATIADARIAAGILTATQVDITNLNVSGVTTSTDKEIYNQFDITNNGASAYQFAATGIGFTQATDNPTLYLSRGKNYRFSVNASGHPFYIKTVNSTGTGNAYNDGVDNNGAAVGIITFKVPYNAPDILHYNCSIHSSMHGEIRVGAQGGGIGVGSEGTFIGAGATMIDFKSSNGSNTVDLTAGIATVTVQTGVSLGLAIALGG